MSRAISQALSSMAAATPSSERLVGIDLGEPPLRYLTRTRLAHRRACFGTPTHRLPRSRLARGTAAGFGLGRPFTRMFGVAPGAYREHEPDPPVSVAARAGATRDAQLPGASTLARSRSASRA
jgi:hypothetical protein